MIHTQENMSNPIKLTPGQQKAYDLMCQGKNICLTGPAGTGKSCIIKMFKEKFSLQKTIAITSTTGISALSLGGSTLHSYLGIGLGTGSVGALSTKILKKAYLKRKWLNLDVLIIDEVSMLSPVLFDKLEEIARIIRHPGPSFLNVNREEKPWGGIQLILCADFCQLPVVNSEDFCFEAKSWEKSVDITVNLTEIIRQDDPVFQKVLNDLRFGKVTKRAKALLESRKNVELKNDSGIKPTRIYTTNADISRINEEELDNLAREDPDLEFVEYKMDIELYQFVNDRQSVIDKYRKNCIAPNELQLCVGAQVMLLCNLPDIGLVNGSRGVITRFIEDIPMVRFLDGDEHLINYNIWEVEQDDKKLMRMTQIPLRPAWAITVHKCQSITLDYAEIDLSNIFEYGQAYVALSRTRKKEGLSILDIDYDKIRAHPKAIDFYKKLDSKKA